MTEPTDMRIEEAQEATAELVAELGHLVRQLSSSAPAPSPAEVSEIIASPATHLVVARNGEGSLVGSLTLVIFRIPTGLRAWIEDVVVDESSRGKQLGEALTRHALKRAGEAGERKVDLTSRPDRTAANRLYRRVGFELRETNVYRFSIPGAE